MGVPELAVSTLFHILPVMDEEERDQSFYPVSCLTSSIGSRAQMLWKPVAQVPEIRKLDAQTVLTSGRPPGGKHYRRSSLAGLAGEPMSPNLRHLECHVIKLTLPLTPGRYPTHSTDYVPREIAPFTQVPPRSNFFGGPAMW